MAPPVTSVRGPKQPPGLTFPKFQKYCKNFIGAQNMPIHLITYIFNRGVDTSKTNLLKKALKKLLTILTQKQNTFPAVLSTEKLLR